MNSKNIYEQLQQWHTLLKNGTLTHEEFDKIKAGILQKENQPKKTNPSPPNEKVTENNRARVI